jgi:hypothetical protein
MWNALSPYRAGVSKHVKTELELYRIDTAAIQETRCGEVEFWIQGTHTDVQ